MGTTTEIEVKVLEIDTAKIVAQIEAWGGVCTGNWLMRTSLYDFPDRRLLNNGGHIRIRNEGDTWHCTYKRKISDTEAKVMEELDLGISDPDTADKILRALGLERILYFEKKRLHYQKDHIVFDIDELPRIPTYLEIEAPSWEEILQVLQVFNIPREKALPIGPKSLLHLYGIDIDKIGALRF